MTYRLLPGFRREVQPVDIVKLRKMSHASECFVTCGHAEGGGVADIGARFSPR